MGRKTAEIRVSAQLSNHNSEADERDRAAWDRFVADVRALAQIPEYVGLEIDVSDQGSW
jgi:hypothetical protein